MLLADPAAFSCWHFTEAESFIVGLTFAAYEPASCCFAPRFAHTLASIATPALANSFAAERAAAE